MRVLLPILLLLTLQPAEPPRLRLLLRDAHDAGVAGVTLTLRTEDHQTMQLATDAAGVALSGALDGRAVWLVGGRAADGRALVAESYPAGVGFRLALLPGRTRDALLRLEEARIVLDPDMILGDESGAPLGPPPTQLTVPVPPLGTIAPTVPVTEPETAPPVPSAAAGRRLLLLVVGVLSLLGLALLVGLLRRRAS